MNSKIVAAMPAYSGVDPDTVGSLLALAAGARDVLVDWISMNYMYVDEARNAAVRMVLDDLELPKILAVEYRAEDVTHLLLLDSDMLWPKDMVKRLLAHGRQVVGGLYFQKAPPFVPVPYDFDGTLKVERLAEIGLGLRRVGGLGMGATLVSVNVFRRMRDLTGDEKWFCSTECGEDVHFCRRIAGFLPDVEAWLDQDLVCGHVGRQVVTDQHWRLYRQFQQQTTQTVCANEKGIVT